MTTVAHSDKRGIPSSSAAPMQNKKEDNSTPIPEIVEERRKDAEGRYVVVNRYTRGKLLGKGGFAKCFVGTTASERLVALKIVDKSSLSKSRAKSKLQTEIAIHKTLRHPHICKFERFFECPSFVYMILELANNNSMSELMKRRKTLLEPEVRYYTSQIIQALKFLHDNLVIHRDLKLGNLFIDHEMRIKIGDFGLATKLSHPGERKRTVCGTPNYIAPEILEGKSGHSFEVDIWSTGVLIFTLLYGKPPFESKDVKSTYKRILSNNYSFPDHAQASNENPKALIRHMLQNCPENRPSLDGIMHADFFSQPAYTPTFLPTCALKIPPNMPNETSSASSTLLKQQAMLKQAGKQTYVNDENDSKMANNANIQHEYDAKVPAKPTKAVPANSQASSVQSKQQSTAVRKPLARLEDMMSLPNSAGNAHTASNAQRSIVTRSQKQNFDIYQDAGKPVETGFRARAAEPSDSSEGVMVVEQMEDMSASASTAANNRIFGGGATNVPPFFSSSGGGHSMDVSEGNTGGMVTKFENNEQKAEPVNPSFPVKQAWGGSSDLPYEETKSTRYSQGYQAQAVSQSAAPKPSVPLQQQLFVSPPKELIHSHLPKREPNTLETMHGTLSNTFTGNNPQAKVNMFVDVWKNDGNALANAADSTPKKVAADVWVVRYVNYTSKYGLGFLLNNGAAGVYFNDNTKIVLSSDCTVFQYIERKRRSSLSGTSGSSGEHAFQTHYINSHPPELQKKVTLLKHFRNYLVDQQRIHGEGGDTEAGENGGFPASVSTGSCTNMESNAMDASEFQALLGNRTGENISSVTTSIIPFLKKWVQTRHAILFRLSNKTVQVVFFDKSEILLTAEAHIITYVNKEGQRSEHSLQEALQSGRVDVIKRLKYAKDIMYKLINIQSSGSAPQA